MEPLLQEVLEAAGVTPDNDRPLVSFWEDWIDPPSGVVSSSWSLEECAPLDAVFYRAFSRLLAHAWNQNVLRLLVEVSVADNEHHNQTSSLRHEVDAVRVTAWLREVMDLHVDEARSFTELLLQHADSDLVDALFQHMTQLSTIQQQIHYWTQATRQRMTRAAVVADRAKHYQKTQQRSERLLSELNHHVQRLEYVLGDLYRAGNVEVRTLCRSQLGRFWQDFLYQAARPTTRRMENTSAVGVDMTLRLLYRILQGTSQLQPSHRHLMFHQLLPLHTPNNMVLWRDQTALLELYHEPLVQCVCFLLRQQPDWMAPVIQALVQPDLWGTGNTPKTVLLLHEMDTLLGLLEELDDKSSLRRQCYVDETTWNALLTRLTACVASDNSRTAERALQFFRNGVVRDLVLESYYNESVPTLLRSLVRQDDQLPWNPTVRKMTHHVLLQIQQYNADKFRWAAQCVFGGLEQRGRVVKSAATDVKEAPPRPAVTTTSSQRTAESARPLAAPQDFSLKSGMGSWRPPPSSTSRPTISGRNSMLPPASRRPPRSARAPPLTVTGVAPWADKKPPPLTITGVAPWAQNNASDGGSSSTQPPAAIKQTPQLEDSPMTSVRESEDETEGCKEQGDRGLAHVISYMDRLKPQEEDESGTSWWARAQMAESPTLLPTLKFHDLVFGHELGSGAFGSVRYARHIVQGKTRSHWPEYAVKIVSTQKIVDYGYEASIQREIAVLRILSHPCIARLISSFRFRDGAYLVLEYASQGDLHSLLRQHGSLDEESTRFVVGELVAALASIHDSGFVYGDLKPENVLITEPGHIKLTDFGGCRPVTVEAKEKIRDSGKNLLAELRDGDWKSSSTRQPESNNTSEDEDGSENGDIGDFEESHDVEEDIRVEGTTAYLPPEVVMGEFPSIAADSWALGCVIFQCLSGRPPLLDVDDDKTRDKIVTFEESSQSSTQSDPLFTGSHASGISDSARVLIRELLTREPTLRPTMTQVASHVFFRGMDCFSLHQHEAHPLDVGKVSPAAEDSQWTRRQFSSIWAPQPKAYNVSLPVTQASLPLSTSTAAIPEGEEANAFFTASRQTSLPALT